MSLVVVTKPDAPSLSGPSFRPMLSSVGFSRHRISPYILAFLSVGACTAIAVLVRPYALPQDEEMIYLLGILGVALRFDVKVSTFAAVSSVLTLDFFFIPPLFRFAWSDTKRMLTFLGMIIVAGVVSGLNERLRHQEKSARRTAMTREALYRLNVDLASAGHPQNMVAAAARHLEQHFGSAPMILLRTLEGVLERPPIDLTSAETDLLKRAWTRNEFSASGELKGYSVWVPLVGVHELLGVVGLQATPAFEPHSEHGLLFSACARELAIVLERWHLANAVHRAQLDAETERMRSSLLSAISHDLKTPLSNIVATGSTLLAHRTELDGDTADELLASIVAEGERLTRLIQNLLSITRLESPTIDLKRTPEAVEELVAAVLLRLHAQIGTRTIEVHLAPDLPWILAEPALIEQVLTNLVENAIRYTPAHAPISISAQVADGGVDIQVADAGSGIPEHEWDRVFEKFYRGSRAIVNDGGAGLGLTICRAIVRAHGGSIALRSRPGGGTLVEFTLPIARVPHSHYSPEADNLT